MLQFPRTWINAAHTYTTSISQWFGSTIYQVNNFFSLFALFQKKRNFCTHTHTHKIADPFIYLFGMFSKQSHSIATFIYEIEWGKEWRKKLRESEHSKKLVYVQVLWLMMKQVITSISHSAVHSHYSIIQFQFSWRAAKGRVEQRRRKKQHSDDKQHRCDKLFYELEQTEAWFEMAVSYAIKLSLNESLSLKWNFKGISHFFPPSQMKVCEEEWVGTEWWSTMSSYRIAMQRNVYISIAIHIFM